MTNTEKFVSDIQKIKKHYRAEHSTYDGEAVCREVADLFARNNRSLAGLGESVADYWLETYVRSEGDLSEAPTDSQIEKISAMQSLLEDDYDSTKALTKEDLKELCSLVNLEAEELPLETLSSLMAFFVENQAF